MTVGNWHYSRIRVIGNVGDSITEKKTKKQLLFTMTYKKYNFIRNDVFRCCFFVELNKTNEVIFWLTIYSYFDVSMIMVIIIKKK